MVYELREYLAVPGREHELHARFREHTLRLFDRHGLEVIGFWTGAEDAGSVVYLLRFPDEDTRREAWARFQSDPEWQRIKAESEASGPIVRQMTSRTLTGTAYWPGGNGTAGTEWTTGTSGTERSTGTSGSGQATEGRDNR